MLSLVDMKKTLLLICLLNLCFSCSVDQYQKIEIQNPEALDSILDYYVNEGFYPFIYARIENLEGEVMYEHGVKNENLLPETEISEDTWIRIWSMSKIVTISLLLDLVEDDILQLNDPVTKYIPEFKDLKVALTKDGASLTDFGWGERDQVCPIQLVENDSVMTVLHLINHEAGFYYANSGYTCLDSMMAEQNFPKALNSDDLIDKLAKLPLMQHPGTGYFYGTNTTVLGLVAERATGQSLKELVVERITEPLNIEGLQYGLPDGVSLIPKFTGRDSILRKANRGELDIFGPDVPDYEPAHELYLGGEGMLGTADGYADFVRMLVNKGTLNGHRFLEEETVDDIYAPHTQIDNPYGYNGYNLWVSGDSMRINKQGDSGLWIGGGYESTLFWADPKRKFVCILMSQNNQVKAPGWEITDKFRGTLYEQLFSNEN